MVPWPCRVTAVTGDGIITTQQPDGRPLQRHQGNPGATQRITAAQPTQPLHHQYAQGAAQGSAAAVAATASPDVAAACTALLDVCSWVQYKSEQAAEGEVPDALAKLHALKAMMEAVAAFVGCSNELLVLLAVAVKSWEQAWYSMQQKWKQQQQQQQSVPPEWQALADVAATFFHVVTARLALGAGSSTGGASSRNGNSGSGGLKLPEAQVQLLSGVCAAYQVG